MTNYLEPDPIPWRPPEQKKKSNKLEDLDELKKKHNNHDWGSEENDEQN